MRYVSLLSQALLYTCAFLQHPTLSALIFFPFLFRCIIVPVRLSVRVCLSRSSATDPIYTAFLLPSFVPEILALRSSRHRKPRLRGDPARSQLRATVPGDSLCTSGTPRRRELFYPSSGRRRAAPVVHRARHPTRSRLVMGYAACLLLCSFTPRGPRRDLNFPRDFCAQV